MQSDSRKQTEKRKRTRFPWGKVKEPRPLIIDRPEDNYRGKDSTDLSKKSKTEGMSISDDEIK